MQPWAQVTTRLFEAVQAIGLATSGELGTRLADRIGIHTSPTTTLRRIMALAPHATPQGSCLGIDDWSFRRGRTFGTILVDLTTRTIIDLLPDRSTETSAAWMRKHPEIKVVSRDRGEAYAAAARLGAPQAKQVSDRFHLVKNLSEIVETVLARCLTEIRRASRPDNPPDEPLLTELPLPSMEQWRPQPERSAEQASLAYQTELFVTGSNMEAFPLKPNDTAKEKVALIPMLPTCLKGGSGESAMAFSFIEKSRLRDTRALRG